MKGELSSEAVRIFRCLVVRLVRTKYRSSRLCESGSVVCVVLFDTSVDA